MRVISFPGPSWLTTIMTTGLLYSISSTPEVRDKPHPRCPWASSGRTPCCLWVRCSGWPPRQLKPSLRLVTGIICPYCIAFCRNTVSSIRSKYCAVLVHAILDGFLYSCKCRGTNITSSVPRQYVENSFFLIHGQVRLFRWVRLQTDNFRSFLSQQTDKQQTSVCRISKR